MRRSTDATSSAQSTSRVESVITVIIPAFNEAERIANTVTATLSVAEVTSVLVVDDGSSDGTADVAHTAGAYVVVQRSNQGKGAAMLRGYAVAVTTAAALDELVVVFLDADLEATAAELLTLAKPVLNGEADMSIATLPPQTTAGGGRGFVVRLAREGIKEATGWVAGQPLSGQRAVRPVAFSVAVPLASGFGVEVGLTIDVLRAGYVVKEVEVPFHHRVTGKGFRAQRHRAKQFWHVWKALRARGVGPRLPLPR